MSFHRDFEVDGERFPVSLQATGDGRYEVKVGDRVHAVAAVRLPDGRVRFAVDGVKHEAAAASAADGQTHVRVGTRSWMLPRYTGRGRGHGAAADGVITAPMTGTVLKLPVRKGDEVTADQTVAVVSAMKMEHKLLAGIAGTVVEVATSEGTTLDQGALILRIE